MLTQTRTIATERLALAARSARGGYRIQPDADARVCSIAHALGIDRVRLLADGERVARRAPS